MTDPYLKRDILTGTTEVIVDRDAMIALNKDNIALLRDIRRLLNRLLPAVQLLVRSENPTVSNTNPVDCVFMGEGKQQVATKIAVFGSADFFYDFDAPASVNSPMYSYNNKLGEPLILDVECQRLSILGVSSTAMNINNTSAPNANYIGVRAWCPGRFVDDAAI